MKDLKQYTRGWRVMYQLLDKAETRNIKIKLLEKVLSSQENPVEFYYEILSVLNQIERENKNKGGRAS